MASDIDIGVVEVNDAASAVDADSSAVPEAADKANEEHPGVVITDRKIFKHALCISCRLVAAVSFVGPMWNDETNDGRTQRRHRRTETMVLGLVLVPIIRHREACRRRSLFCADISNMCFLICGI